MTKMDRETPKKKLIEVALPLVAINTASAREKSIRHGHPSTLHLWWARRPLAAARAVIFAQMVDDPSSHPERFATEEEQEVERQRFFRIIEDLVLWENTTNEKVLEQARQEIWKSWRSTCAENQNHPRAKELFNPEKLPAFHDPFAGGGALPLEAQRLGLESYASDLNPVAVLINKAMIEIPPKFAGQRPVNPDTRMDTGIIDREWRGAQGLAEDVRYYGQWMRNQAEQRIGHLYPKLLVTAEMAKSRPDLNAYVGKELTVIAWLWARTVKSPNPAFAKVDVPLTSTFMLSTKAGKEAYIEALIGDGGYEFTVKMGKPRDVAVVESGTKLSRGANFRCLMSGAPIPGDYIKAEGKAGRIGVRMMAIVVQGERGRIYLPPTQEMEAAARVAKPTWEPDLTISGSTQYLGIKPYGMEQFSQLFTDRQLVALTTFVGLLEEARRCVERDAIAAGLPGDGKRLHAEGAGANAYSDAVAIYLGMAVSKLSAAQNALVIWKPQMDQAIALFGRQAISMVWDFAESSPFNGAAGDLATTISGMMRVIDNLSVTRSINKAYQADATQGGPNGMVISTDPPYFDNVPYADLSDFFYVWLRQLLRQVLPDLFATVAVPKAEELVAFAHRHDGKAAAELFFLEGMTQAMQRLAGESHPAFPVSIYYAFRQTETDSEQGTASTGWDTFLDALIRAGFSISGTWPIRTEYTGNLKIERNALASSIILVCRPRPANSPIATRREFLTALKTDLPVALKHLQRSNIAPVDLAQAAIGPGMAVYSRYASVVDAESKRLTVREALTLINQTLDEVLAEQDSDFDVDSRWALAWFEQSGFAEGSYGIAETLSKAKNTSLSAMVEAGIIRSKGGKVRLVRPDELSLDWDPKNDLRPTAWQSVHYLVRALEAGGENAAAELVKKIGSKAEVSRELAYRLYTVCERKKRAQEALSYNGLVQSWPEVTRLAREVGKPEESQPQLFSQE
jgi:putative DNA methylase